MYPPMHAPAELWRTGKKAPLRDGTAIRIATGSLVLMAYGMMAAPAEERRHYYIASVGKTFGDGAVTQMLEYWQLTPKRR